VLQIAVGLPYVLPDPDGSNHVSLAHYSSPDYRTAISADLCTDNTQQAFAAIVTNAQTNYLSYLGISDMDR
jgi:hypothetical protein